MDAAAEARPQTLLQHSSAPTGLPDPLEPGSAWLSTANWGQTQRAKQPAPSGVAPQQGENLLFTFDPSRRQFLRDLRHVLSLVSRRGKLILGCHALPLAPGDRGGPVGRSAGDFVDASLP